MTATRAAIIMGAIPVLVGLLYLVLQVAFGDPVDDFLAGLIGNIDPAGVILLIALGISMGFGFFVILRGARDL